MTHSTTPLVIDFTSYIYTYSNTHKHAVTALSSGESYTYDAHGNMTARVEGGLTYNQTFDAENRLISVTVNSQTTHFIYNGNSSCKMIYLSTEGLDMSDEHGLLDLPLRAGVGGIYELDKTSGGTVTGTKPYYPAAGAMRITVTSLFYFLSIHSIFWIM